MATVVLSDASKRYGEHRVVDGINLSVADGEFVVLVGPSGCGKSTLLRMIAGLETISAGDLLIGGLRANAVPVQQRNIAMVFQSYALYPHLTAQRNIAYGPRVRREPGQEITRKVDKAARILGLSDYLARLPRQLSGGQRQRVAMGRAIVRSPSVFLFDEPLSNLDAKLRVEMRAEIKTLHRRLGSTIVYVTHDQVEAMTMADRIVVMNAGHIEQVGTPEALYDRPANIFVAGFLGLPSMSFLPGRISRTAGAAQVVLSDGSVLPLAGERPVRDGQAVVAGVRPEHFGLAEDQGLLTLEVGLVEPTGAETHVHGTVAGERVIAALPGRHGVAAGERIGLSVRLPMLHLFDAQTTRRIDGARAV